MCTFFRVHPEKTLLYLSSLRIESRPHMFLRAPRQTDSRLFFGQHVEGLYGTAVVLYSPGSKARSPSCGTLLSRALVTDGSVFLVSMSSTSLEIALLVHVFDSSAPFPLNLRILRLYARLFLGSIRADSFEVTSRSNAPAFDSGFGRPGPFRGKKKRHHHVDQNYKKSETLQRTHCCLFPPPPRLLSRR